MKLSDAILKGCEQRGQAFNMMYDDQRDTTCVLGAAYGGLTGELPHASHFTENLICLTKHFPILYNRIPIRTAEGQTLDTVSLQHAIVSLNDDAMWSREKIAKWVKQYEE